MPATAWPALPYAEWRETRHALHLWTQVVGKLRLALTPWLNHGWHVPLYVTARGLGTSPMPHAGGVIELEFDFIDHALVLRASDGTLRSCALRAESVAAFFAGVQALLADAGVQARIDRHPNEVPVPVPFDEDHAPRPYDRDAAHRFWRALVAVDTVFRQFRTGFVGKASPVHFFWGSFDLAVTRFSGRRAPPHPGGIPHLPDAVTREAYSHEVTSAGFRPGDDAHPAAAFYAYAYPKPEGFDRAAVPAPARWEAALGEWVLPYEAVRGADDPAAALLAFLEGTHAAAADALGWDRAALECRPGRPRRVRPLPPPGAAR